MAWGKKKPKQNRKAVIQLVFFKFNHFLINTFFQTELYRRASYSEKELNTNLIQTFGDYYGGILLTYVLLSGFDLAEKIIYVNSFYNINKCFHTEISYW